MNTSQWKDFVRGVEAKVNEIIDETKDLNPSWMSLPLCKKVSTKDMVYRTQGVTGFGYVELFDEADGIKYDRTYPAYQTEYIPRQRGKGVTVSQKLLHTREADLEAKLDEVRQHRIAMNRTSERNFWQIFNDAFVTTNSTANFPVDRLQDGVSMVSASHPSLVPGVAVRSNLVSGTGSGAYSGVNPDLIEESLFEAMLQLVKQSNGRGLPINYAGRFAVIVPKALEKRAVEITKSELRSQTANNDINYYSGRVDVISTVYLDAVNGGSDTAWYVVALPDSAENATSLRYVELIAPKIETDVDFNTKSLKISIDGDFTFGYSNFEYIVASKGTKTA